MALEVIDLGRLQEDLIYPTLTTFLTIHLLPLSHLQKIARCLYLKSVPTSFSDFIHEYAKSYFCFPYRHLRSAYSLPYRESFIIYEYQRLTAENIRKAEETPDPNDLERSEWIHHLLPVYLSRMVREGRFLEDVLPGIRRDMEAQKMLDFEIQAVKLGVARFLVAQGPNLCGHEVVEAWLPDSGKLSIGLDLLGSSREDMLGSYISQMRSYITSASQNEEQKSEKFWRARDWLCGAVVRQNRTPEIQQFEEFLFSNIVLLERPFGEHTVLNFLVRTIISEYQGPDVIERLETCIERLGLFGFGLQMIFLENAILRVARSPDPPAEEEVLRFCYDILTNSTTDELNRNLIFIHLTESFLNLEDLILRSEQVQILHRVLPLEYLQLIVLAWGTREQIQALEPLGDPPKVYLKANPEVAWYLMTRRAENKNQWRLWVFENWERPPLGWCTTRWAYLFSRDQEEECLRGMVEFTEWALCPDASSGKALDVILGFPDFTRAFSGWVLDAWIKNFVDALWKTRHPVSWLTSKTVQLLKRVKFSQSAFRLNLILDLPIAWTPDGKDLLQKALAQAQLSLSPEEEAHLGARVSSIVPCDQSPSQPQ